MYSLMIFVCQEFQSSLADWSWLAIFMNRLGLQSSRSTWRVSIDKGYWQSWCWLLPRDFFYHHFTAGLPMRYLASPTESDPRQGDVETAVSFMTYPSKSYSTIAPTFYWYLGQFYLVWQGLNMCRNTRRKGSFIGGHLWGLLSHLPPKFISYYYFIFNSTYLKLSYLFAWDPHFSH